MTKKALILLSGGLDSATISAIAKSENYELHAISFDYSQNHKTELEYAKKIANFFSFKTHKIIIINPGLFQNSALTNNLTIPKKQDNKNKIPITYVPARNILFLSYALSYAEGNNISNIFIGANAIDYSGYPDCRPEFIKSFEEMANLGTKLGQSQKITIHTPIINLSKAEIIKLGMKLQVDYSITHSCYDPHNNKACGKCDSCYYRLKGFKENNIADPIEYDLP
ncbi:MAG: 7-cyano-7-deazaguanine synthase QueC [Rickettsiales bacterium]|nr:7-cyano-7-deazaguanine synthase QueC [Rickettsiales bacterium]